MAPSGTTKHYPEASSSDTHVSNPHDTTLVSYSQPTGTNVSIEEVSENYTPYSQANDSSCVLTGQAVPETASSINNFAPYCTISRHQGTICTPDAPAKHYAEWPESVTEGYQYISTSNNPSSDLCSKDASQIDWLADMDF